MHLDRVIAVRNNKTVYRDGNKCIKVFGSSFTKADVLNEALNQAKVEELGLSIPEIYEVISIEGKWAIVSEYIKGKTLQQLFLSDPENKDAYLKLFVELHSEIHQKKSFSLNRLKDKMHAKICSADLKATLRFDLHDRLDSFESEKKLCHGDFNPSNVIIRDDGKPFILDWSHVTEGTAAADAAITYLLFKMEGEDELAEKYIGLYSEINGSDEKDIRKWTPLVAASMSVSCGEEARRFLLSSVH